jgi:cell division protein FtsL
MKHKEEDNHLKKVFNLGYEERQQLNPKSNHKMSIKNLAIVAVVVILCLSNVIIFVKNTDLTAKYEQLYLNYSELSKGYNELNLSYWLAQTENKIIEAELITVKTNISSIRNEIYDLKTELNKMNTDIVTSINWFGDNLNLSKLDTEEFRNIKHEIANCVSTAGGYCEINLCCLDLKNDEDLQFKYLYNISFYNNLIPGIGRLLSFFDFVKYSGGVCRDYSLVFTSEFSYLIDYCNDNGYQNNKIKVTSCEESESDNCNIPNSKYYYPGFRTVSLSGYVYMYPICYRINETVGHCRVLLTDEKITTTLGVEQLQKGVIIEPQEGLIHGYLENSSYYSIVKYYGPSKEGDIYLVILDDGIRTFSTDSNSWIGLPDMLDNINSYAEEIQILNESLNKI